MQFSEKMQLLMKMANTTNTQLGRALGVDPSLISRWRTGARQISHRSPYIPSISSFFAAQAKEDFQRVALLELTGHSMEEKDIEDDILASYLSQWLSNEAKIGFSSMKSLLEAIGNVHQGTSKTFGDMPAITEPEGRALAFQSFFGTKGLQSAAVKLLLRALQSERQEGKLLLYSDEPMDWMISDPLFSKQWSFLMTACIRKGIQITIIHTLARDSMELIEAVRKWLPLYLSGAVVSYYSPYPPDKIFCHTSFTLAGEAAVFSTSVCEQRNDEVLYLFSSEPQMVKSSQEAFGAQLAKCKPLVHALTGKTVSTYLTQQTRFFTRATGSGAALQSLFLLGMPHKLLENILIRMGIEETMRNRMVNEQNNRIKAMEEHLQHKDFLLVMSLPRITDALKGRVPALIVQLLTHKESYYQPMELHDHIVGIIDVLERFERFSVCILPSKYMSDNVQAFAMEDTGMLVLKHHTPQFVFIAEQHDLANAMLAYIRTEANRVQKRERNKTFVIQKLTDFAQRLAIGAAR